MLTTTRFGLNKPQTTDARSALRTALTTNADLLETALDLVTPTTVTALPTTSLFDGKLVYLQTTAMAAVGVRWLMRYRSATSKWEFVGGAPWTFYEIGGESRGPVGAGSAQLLLNNQPLDRAGQLLSAPAAGIYLADLQFQAVRTAGTSEAMHAVLTHVAGGTTQVLGAGTGPVPDIGASGQNGITIRAQGETIDLAAGTAMRIGFTMWDTTMVATLWNKRLRVQPVLLHT